MLTTLPNSVRLAAALLLSCAGIAGAQDYPSKPIRFITSGVGTGVDFAARLVAQHMSTNLGRQVIVENRPSGPTLGQTVAKATPDGYIVLFYGSTFWTMPLVQASSGYDPVKEFAPISIVTTSPNVLVIHPSLPAKSVKELIALAKARPGELNYASSGTGASNHLAAELFNFMAGVNITRIPYADGARASADLISGQVHMVFGNASFTIPHMKSGRLRALAVTSAQPSALLPGLPSIAASGVPGYESGSMFVMFAPAKTAAAVINRLNQETVRVVKQADVRDVLFNTGVEAVGSSPEELAATMKSEIARLVKVVKQAGIRVD
jgi:tripartite-type tricarboxylate transporter receptor subunit TctC